MIYADTFFGIYLCTRNLPVLFCFCCNDYVIMKKTIINNKKQKVIYEKDFCSRTSQTDFR